MVIRAAVLWLALALPAGAEGIVSGLSQNRVSITADFDGSEILIYGAVKRDAPAPEGSPLQVIVTVEGPSTPVTIRRKARRAGIWINTDVVTVEAAPSFYAIASTAPLAAILSDTDDLRHRVTLGRIISAVGATTEAADAPSFLSALMRLRGAEQRYRLDENGVRLTEGTLFRADVLLPANLTEGDYRVRIFLTRDRAVIDAQESVINVRKEGLERLIYTLAHDQPLVYGAVSLLLAVAAGWGASAAFRLVRP